jgi:hypothetical protein
MTEQTPVITALRAVRSVFEQQGWDGPDQPAGRIGQWLGEHGNRERWS